MRQKLWMTSAACIILGSLAASNDSYAEDLLSEPSDAVSDVTYVLQSRVSASADDAEEEFDGSVDLKSSDLEMVVYHDLPQTVGVRFTNLSIPENAIIKKAYIQYQVDERSVNNANITIYGESTANALGFTKTDFNISDRSKTNTSVLWSPAAWDTIGVAGEEQRTPDLSPIVQEIISETSWESDNAIAFILSGDGVRVAEAYDGDQAGAPLLYVEYTIDSSNTTPVVEEPVVEEPVVEESVVEEPVVEEPVVEEPVVEEPVVEEPVVEEPVVEEPVVEEPVVEESVVEESVVEESVVVVQNRVSASADDAEEESDGSVDLKSSDLEMVVYHGLPQTVGVRFTNLSIPDNAVITKAYIQYQVDERSVNSADITIHGESTANALGFTKTDFNISDRSKTNTSVLWTPAAWDSVGAAGEEQRTPDLSSIVQEIISETGWESDNAMAFILSGDGVRVAEAYDGDQAGAPLLYVEYITDGSSTAPVIEEPVVEEPVVEEPVVEEPVVEEPVVEEPAIEEPVVEEPVIEEPVVEELVADTSSSGELLPPYQSLPLYSADSVWNQTIPSQPEIDPESAVMIDALVAAARTGYDPTLNVKQWSVPVYVADADTPRYSVAITGSNTQYGFQAMIDVPIPDNAQPDPQRDGHMVIMDISTGYEYDFWRAVKNADGSWQAAWGNRISLDSNGIFPTGSGAKASGFAAMAGIIWPEEFKQGRIDHALFMALPIAASGGFVYPATASDGWITTEGAIPRGRICSWIQT